MSYTSSSPVLSLCFALSALLWCECSQTVTTTNPGIALSPLPDGIKSLFNSQAPIVGFYAAVAQDRNYLDTAELPAWATARAYMALGLLWQTKGMPERDTVFDIYAVGEGAQNDFHDILLCSDSPEKYASVLARYQFKRDSTLPLTVFKSALLLNTLGVAREINDSIGFMCEEPNWYGGGGDEIRAQFAREAVTLTYTVGYGDCFAGCMAYRHWVFQVSDNGYVRFLGASGNRPPTREEHR